MPPYFWLGVFKGLEKLSILILEYYLRFFNSGRLAVVVPLTRKVGHRFSSDVITDYMHNSEESIHESAVRRQEYLERIMDRFQQDGEQD